MKPSCKYCGTVAVEVWPTIDVYKCSSCGLHFRYPVPTPEELDALYKRGWGGPNTNLHETGGTTPRLAARYAALLDRDVPGGLRNKILCDYGSGRGDLVAAMAARGARVVGVDPYGAGYMLAKGLQAFPDISSAIRASSSTGFDGITLNDVIEHVYDPLLLLTELRNALRPGGWLFVSTPNAAGLKARILQSRWREARKPVHLYFFTAKSLTALAMSAGFTLADRLKWHIRFSNNPIDVLWHFGLQQAAQDGSVRILFTAT
jgi:2-polyprenyl-3-methyl-5-hydroxy-6-metoxy-1,4-benzoquinol methylase